MDRELPLVLLIEDDMDHAELIRESLQSMEAANRLVHVSDGQAALEYLFGGPGKPPRARPQLILQDLRLPKVDGLTVLKRVKESDHLVCVPVIILTTSDRERDMQDAYRNGANSYLVKPFDYDQFSRMLKDLEDYWLGWNRVSHGC